MQIAARIQRMQFVAAYCNHNKRGNVEYMLNYVGIEAEMMGTIHPLHIQSYCEAVAVESLRFVSNFHFCI